MTEIITRCPGCSASLRASKGHLQAANGQVRCGSCLLIFDARTHKIADELLRDDAPKNNLSLDSDDLLIYDDMDISVLDVYEQKQEQENPPVLPPNNENVEPHKEMTPTELALNEALPITELEPPEHTKATDDVNAGESTQDLVATDISLPQPFQQDLPIATEYNSVQPPSVDSTINTETEINLSEPNKVSTIPDFPFDPSKAPQRNYLKMALWPTLSALAMMALAIQYIYFHADLLATDPTYRPWLMRFCDITTCKLPIMKDTTKIRSSKLFVHSHPTISDALIVDAIIINEANFDQPFPELALNFEDLQGTSVAHRNFKPEEYLHGEMTGVSIMPAGRPVRLRLELLDPGASAVNYSLFIPE
ncbi:MAG: zinc-ribbon and DUF3426 domain-containing protein [Porticoccus sp.]